MSEETTTSTAGLTACAEKANAEANVRPVDFSTGSNVVIRVENIWKQYRLGTINHGTLAKDLQSWWARLCGKEDPNLPVDQINQALDHPAGSSNTKPGVSDRFWALRDISFDVKQGEILGIIGKNGAGKSTLLKILSQVTLPTRGQIKVKGRIASLLEVGTGFHPELTGRENVFLNGAILGMSKLEIARKLDEIIAFAEIERFIDTPVKRYSSGMYVRLAFAVAAHLEPEILVVDEVLAVGDAQFQKKCIGKMEEVGREGRTVLFVSHNMMAVRSLCPVAAWLKDGMLHQTGQTIEITESYLSQSARAVSVEDVQGVIQSLPEDPSFRLDAVVIKQRGKVCTTILNGDPIEVEVSYTVREKVAGLRVYFDLCDEERNILVRSFNDTDSEYRSVIEPGHYVSCAKIPADLLAPRSYELRIYGTIYNVRSVTPGGVGLPLQVERNNDINSVYPNEPIRSKLLLRIPWKTEPVQKEVT